MPIFNGIPYHERPGSPQESLSGDTWRARRILDVPWGQRWAFLAGIFGEAFLVGVDTTGEADVTRCQISRKTPPAYTVDIGNGQKAFMYPTGLDSMEGVGIQSWDESIKQATFVTARLTLNYEAVHYTVLSDSAYRTLYGSLDESHLGRYTSIWIQPTAEYLTLPFGAFSWVDGNMDASPPTRSAPVTGSYGRIISTSEIMIVWHRVPGIPVQAYKLLGSVNHEEFGDAARNLIWNRGTLLYTNVEIKPYRWFDNYRYYDVTYKFKHFNPRISSTVPALLPSGELGVGHNFFLRQFPQNKTTNPLLPQYQMLTHNGAGPNSATTPGTPVYPYEDFSTLFSYFKNTDDSPIFPPA